MATPYFVPFGGTFSTAQAVTIGSTPGAVIHYTTDGTTPVASSPVYSSPIQVSTASTLKAIALETGDTTSGVGSASYSFAAGAKPTSVALLSSLTTLTPGESVTFSAAVETTDGTTASGTIAFLHGGVLIGTAPLADGKATLTTTSLENRGTYSITAYYTGSTTEAVSQSPSLYVTVTP